MLMSLRWRLIGSIVAMLSVLWLAASVWFFFDARAELQQVLDARMASSARMVQGLIAREELRLPEASDVAPAEPAPAESLRLPSELLCQLWTLDGEFISTDGRAPLLPAGSVPDGISNQLVEGERWRIFALTDPANGVRILTAERRDLRRSLIMGMTLNLAAPLGLALPVTLLLVWLAVRRGLIPLERLRRSVQTRSAASLEPLPLQGVPQELGPMVRTLNKLFARLSSALGRERRFTGDAAHELRTPLAGVKSQLQIARSTSGEQRQRALNQAETGLDRMSLLVTQMLMLARLESRPAEASGTERAQIDEVLGEILQELRPLAEQRGLALHADSAALTGSAALPPLMLHAALRNLLENAIRHGADGKLVELRGERLAEGTRIDILDRGPGLPEAELAQVTARFYRPRTTEDAGSGLGLSIVAAIAQRYGLTLTLANRGDGPGLLASLDLPAPDGCQQHCNQVSCKP